MRHLRRLACVVSFPVAALSACTITPPSGSSTSDQAASTARGGSSSGSSDDHGCAAACAVYDKANCPDQTLSECLSYCATSAAKCPAEITAFNACIVTTTASCDRDGLAFTNGCDAEAAARTACEDGESGAKTCAPFVTSSSSQCSGACPQPVYKETGNVQSTWCTLHCDSDSDCSTVSGTKCIAGACEPTCTSDGDCAAFAGANGCDGEGYCY